MNPSTGADVSLDDDRSGGQAMEGPAVARPRVLGAPAVAALVLVACLPGAVVVMLGRGGSR